MTELKHKPWMPLRSHNSRSRRNKRLDSPFRSKSIDTLQSSRIFRSELAPTWRSPVRYLPQTRRVCLSPFVVEYTKQRIGTFSPKRSATHGDSSSRTHVLSLLWSSHQILCESVAFLGITVAIDRRRCGSSLSCNVKMHSSAGVGAYMKRPLSRSSRSPTCNIRGARINEDDVGSWSHKTPTRMWSHKKNVCFVHMYSTYDMVW